jgi:hypothetical protein
MGNGIVLNRHSNRENNEFAEFCDRHHNPANSCFAQVPGRTLTTKNPTRSLK